MAKRYVTIQQYEPLRAPASWSNEERALIQQLTDRFDDLYGRLNRLRFEDLGTVMQKRITASEGSISQIRQTASDLVLTVSGGTHIFRQASPPTEGVLHGDLWYDSDDSNKCYRFANGQWQVIPYANAIDAIEQVAQTIITSEQIQNTVRSTVTTMIGYRVEIVSDHGGVLTDRISQTVLTANVWQGNNLVTDQIDAGRFVWTRHSQDAMADQIWNDAHRGVKSVTVNTSDVVYEATFQCDILGEE